MTTRNLFDFYAKEAKRLGYLARSAFKLQEIQKKHRIIPPGGSVLDLGCSPGSWLQVACASLGPPTKGGLILGVDLTKTPIPGKHCDKRVTTIQADVLQILPSELLAVQPKGFDAVLSDMAPRTCGVARVDVAKSLALAQAAMRLATGRELPRQSTPGGRENKCQEEEEEKEEGECRKRQGEASSTVRIGEEAVEVASVDGFVDTGRGGERVEEPRKTEGVGEGVLKPGGHFVVKILEGSGVREWGREIKPDFKKVSWMRPKAIRSESREVYLVALHRL